MTEYFLNNIFTFIHYFSNYKSLSRCFEEYEKKFNEHFLLLHYFQQKYTQRL